MTIIAVILNLLMLVAITATLVMEGWPSLTQDTFFYLVFLLLVLCPGANLLVHLSRWRRTWFGAFCERKKLEERKKIEILKAELAEKVPA